MGDRALKVMAGSLFLLTVGTVSGWSCAVQGWPLALAVVPPAVVYLVGFAIGGQLPKSRDVE